MRKEWGDLFGTEERGVRHRGTHRSTPRNALSENEEKTMSHSHLTHYTEEKGLGNA